MAQKDIFFIPHPNLEHEIRVMQAEICEKLANFDVVPLFCEAVLLKGDFSCATQAKKIFALSSVKISVSTLKFENGVFFCSLEHPLLSTHCENETKSYFLPFYNAFCLARVLEPTEKSCSFQKQENGQYPECHLKFSPESASEDANFMKKSFSSRVFQLSDGKIEEKILDGTKYITLETENKIWVKISE